jgi:hypothetical protein
MLSCKLMKELMLKDPLFFPENNTTLWCADQSPERRGGAPRLARATARGAAL